LPQTAENRIAKELSKGTTALHTFWQEKIVQPVAKLLKQGLTPRKIALSMAVGAALGIFPALGTTTTLCIVATIALKLNTPAIQLMNFLVYPLQLLLLIPFYRAGAYLFGAQQLPLSPAAIVELFRRDSLEAIVLLWDSTLHAIVVWGVLSPALVAAVYFLLLPIMKRLPMTSLQPSEENA